MRSLPLLSVALLVVACGSSSDVGRGGADAGPADAGPDASRADGALDASATDASARADAAFDAAGEPDAPPIPPSLACNVPISAADTSSPTTVVGAGTHQCTESALRTAVAAGGVITFDCGGPATITLTSELALPKGKATTIDGGGMVTLDGGHATRILSFDGGGYRTTSTTITLQHLAFQNGKATGTALMPEPAPCSQGFDTDAGGGAVYVRDGVLHVVDCTFTNNAGATPGPDVAGGAVYVNGSMGATIVGSRFTGNTCSNGGAVGSLNSDLAIYDSVLSGNSATGTGGNNTSSACTSPSTEIGDGGSGGAVYLDGGSDGDTVFCGDAFDQNTANALGGAIFRVFDNATKRLVIDVSTLDSNIADGPVGTDGSGPGGGALYVHNANLEVTASTISRNSSPGCGAVQVDATQLTFTNVTAAENVATAGIGGALCIFSNGGTITNSTFAGNQANGGSSYSNFYGAAIFGGGLTLSNTILANNTTMNSMGRMTCAATEAGQNDLQWPMTKVVGGSNDSPCLPGITFADPMLGALGDNGGSTETMAPAAAPSVIQVGTSCPALDQAGQPRKTPCTLGALER
jgi:hypothetical protein